MKKIVAVLNQKGGVGKTTTAINLSCGLAVVGQRVLLIDLDPQGHSTIGVGAAERYEHTVQEVLLEKLDIRRAITETETPGLSLVAANLHLDRAEQLLIPEYFREGRLKTALVGIEDDYDFILIDCRPTLGILTTNALFACSFIIVPTDMGRYSLEGFADLMDSIKAIKGHEHRDMKTFLRILLTMYDAREAIVNEWVESQLKDYKKLLFQTRIRKLSGIKQAQIAEEPIMTFAPASPAAKDYQILTKEFLSLCPA